MANRRKQSRFRRRYRHDCRPHVHALPQCQKRHRADAPAPILNRCFLTPPLLETVASSKRHTTDPRFSTRYHLSKPDFEGHLRCTSEKGHRRHRLLVCAAGISTSALAATSRQFGAANTNSTPIQNVARTPCRIVRRCVLNPRAHGWTCRCHVPSPPTFRQHPLRRHHNRHLLPAQLHQNPVLLPVRTLLFRDPHRSNRPPSIHRTWGTDRHCAQQSSTRTPILKNRPLFSIRHRCPSTTRLIVPP